MELIWIQRTATQEEQHKIVESLEVGKELSETMKCKVHKVKVEKVIPTDVVPDTNGDYVLLGLRGRNRPKTEDAVVPALTVTPIPRCATITAPGSHLGMSARMRDIMPKGMAATGGWRTIPHHAPRSSMNGANQAGAGALWVGRGVAARAKTTMSMRGSRQISGFPTLSSMGWFATSRAR